MKAKDILTDASKWTKGAFARDENGELCGPGGCRARRWCILGALRRAYGETVALEDAIGAVSGVIPNLDSYSLSGEEIASWNDDPDRTFEDVRRVLEIADV